MNKIKVAVLKGGESSEREVSLVSGSKVTEHIPKDKYEVLEYDPKDDILKLIKDIEEKKIDVVFPVLHGKYGEDGTIQGLLELLHVPYTGCGVLCSALTLDKVKTKQVVKDHGIVTPEFEIVKRGDQVVSQFPCVVKPVDAGSSVGISIPESAEEFKDGILNAFKESEVIMIEEFIKGREFTVGVIGPNNNPQVLPVTEIKANVSKFYDYKAKYEEGGSTHICPAEIDEELKTKMQETAVRVYQILGCQGMSRVDFMVSEEGVPYFIEVNTIPGMTDVSLLPEAAKAGGIEFPELLDKIITWAIQLRG